MLNTLPVTRYISIKQDGMETYTEQLPASGDMSEYIGQVRRKLQRIRTAMPNATWQAVIEEQWYDVLGKRAYRMLDVETQELLVQAA